MATKVFKANADFSKMRKKLKSVAPKVRTAAPDHIGQAARLAAISCAMSTQPFGTGLDAKSAGENAIKHDLFGGKHRPGIFLVLPDEVINKAMDTGVYSTGNVRLFVNKDGTVYGTDRVHFLPNASLQQLVKIHDDARSKTSGRTSQAGGWDKTTGRWKFTTQYTIRQKAADALLKFLQKRVGFAKGAWANMARQLGGTRGLKSVQRLTNSQTPDISAAWILRHKTSPYRLIRVSTNPDHPVVVMTTLVRYTEAILTPNQRRNAERIAYERLAKSLLIAAQYEARKSLSGGGS